MAVANVEVDDELMKFIDEKGYELVGFRIPKEGEKYITSYRDGIFDVYTAESSAHTSIATIIRMKFKWPDFISEDYKYCVRTGDNYYTFYKHEPFYDEDNMKWAWSPTGVYIRQSFFKEKLYDDNVDIASSLRKRL